MRRMSLYSKTVRGIHIGLHVSFSPDTTRGSTMSRSAPVEDKSVLQGLKLGRYDVLPYGGT